MKDTSLQQHKLHTAEGCSHPLLTHDAMQGKGELCGLPNMARHLPMCLRALPVVFSGSPAFSLFVSKRRILMMAATKLTASICRHWSEYMDTKYMLNE